MALGHADYDDGVSEAVWALSDYYFGDYGCPGYLDTITDDDDVRHSEHEKLARLAAP